MTSLPAKNDHIYVVYNQETQSYEHIDLYTGEVISEASRSELLSKYVYTPELGRIICQKVTEGKPLSTFGKKDDLPPYAVIQAWRRMFPDFEEAIRYARQMRAEYYHDKALETADELQAGGLNKEDIMSKKAATETYKWAAERNAPSEFGNKQPQGDDNGSGATIIVNTGIRRSEPKQTDVEVHNGERTIRGGLARVTEGRESEADERGRGEEEAGIQEDSSGRSDGRQQDEERVGEKGSADD